jgi:hypothetical protein
MTLASALQVNIAGEVTQAEQIKLDWEMSRVGKEDKNLNKSSINLQLTESVSHDCLWNFEPSQPSSPLPTSVKTPPAPGRQHFCGVFGPEDYASGLFPPTLCQWGNDCDHSYLDLPYKSFDAYSIISSVRLGRGDSRRPLPVEVDKIEKVEERNLFAWMDSVNVVKSPQDCPQSVIMERGESIYGSYQGRELVN